MEMTGNSKPNEKQESFDKLEDFIVNKYFKASILGDKREDWVVVIAADVKDRLQDEGKKPRKIPSLQIEYNKETYEFELNFRNQKQLRELKWSEWKKLVGHKLLLQKIPTTNPKTNQQVDGLLIWKVE